MAIFSASVGNFSLPYQINEHNMRYILLYTTVACAAQRKKKSRRCAPPAPSTATRKKFATPCSPNTTSSIPMIWFSSNTRRFARLMSIAVRSRKQLWILAFRGPPSMRLGQICIKRASRGCFPKNAVPKSRASSHRKFAAISRSLLTRRPICRPLYWSKEFEDASVSCSIHALWKKQCEKKGARHREKSVHFPRRSALLDPAL